MGGKVDLDDLAQRVSALFSDAVVQPLSQFFLSLRQDDWIVLISLFGGAVAIGYVLGRTRAYHETVFQNRGESLVSRVVLKNFGPPDYHLINHVTLQMEDGTTQVDHILVSRYGVFVIETKDYKGWIFGGAKQKNWTQVLFRVKYRFQNPIHQNMRHVRAVQHLLNFLPPGAIKSVVVFTGEAEFRTEIPPGVFYISGVVDYLRGQVDEVMSPDQLQLSVGRLETARFAISGQTDIEHVRNLERRHGGAA